MIVHGLALEQFRIHSSLHLKFEQPTTILSGANASGKTSIIEALQLLATGDSFRAGKLKEMVAFGAELGRVKGIVRVGTGEPDDDDATMSAAERAAAVREMEQGFSDPDSLEQKDIEVILTNGQVQGKKSPYRLFSVNGVRRQKRTAAGVLKTVVFRPEDMRLVEGSPSRRRSFLDTPLSMLFGEYAQSVTAYDQTLKRRNKLLEAVREKEQPRSVLEYWNKALIKHGTVLQEERQAFFQFCGSVPFPYSFRAQYQPSLISEERQAEYLDREIIVGHSLIGPHKDDFGVLFDDSRVGTNLDVATYGSRGQQRLAVLWLKHAELSYIEHHTHDLPVLLLDDIMSELDDDSQGLVYELLGSQQSIVTTTDPAVAEAIVEHLQGEKVQWVKMKEL